MSIQLAFITPTLNLEDFAAKSDFHLLLTHLIEEGNKYVEFYKNRRELKILDNGLFENKVASPIDEILKKADLVGADVLVAPDVLYDYKRTEDSVFNFIKELDQRGLLKKEEYGSGYEVLGVPQADNPDDYIKSLKSLQGMKNVSWIGLSKLSVPKSFANVVGNRTVACTRMYLTALMFREKLIRDNIKYHLLGLDFVGELKYQDERGFIYSNDSSAAVWQGSRGLLFDEALPLGVANYTDESVDFNEAIKKKQFDTINHNIFVAKKLAGHPLKYIDPKVLEGMRAMPKP